MIINTKYEEQIINCEPIEWKGLTLYPIKISRIKDFKKYRYILSIMQQALPIEFSTMTYLKMLYQLDQSGMQFSTDSKGNMYSLLAFLNMALNYNFKMDDNFLKNICEFIQIILNPLTGELIALQIQQKQSQTSVRITDIDFIEMRSILAEQNMIELPNETHNIDLIDAQHDMEELNSNGNLECDFEQELYAVAQICHTDTSEIYNWSIRKFYKNMETANRRIMNMQCAIAEGNGSTYKNGNPYPSWIYSRKPIETHIVSDSEMQARAAMGAIEHR